MPLPSVERLPVQRDADDPCVTLRIGSEQVKLSVAEADELAQTLMASSSEWFDAHRNHAWFFNDLPVVIVNLGHGKICVFDLEGNNNYMPESEYERKMLLLALEETQRKLQHRTEQD